MGRQTQVTIAFKMEECPDHHPDTSYLEQDYTDIEDTAEHRNMLAGELRACISAIDAIVLKWSEGDLAGAVNNAEHIADVARDALRKVTK